MYWTTRRTDTLARANLDGTWPSGNLVPGIKEPCDVAVAGEYLYWTSFSGIGRARLDGSQPDPEFIAAGVVGCGIAVDAGHVYWSSYANNRHSIGRAGLDGSEPDPEFIPALPGSVGAIALDPAHIYWTEWHEGMVYGTIGRANLDGTGVNSAWIQTQWFNLGGLAVDARPTPPPLPLPSGSIHFGQVRHDLSSGVTTLDVWVPRRGELAVTAPKLGWKVLTGTYPAALEGSFRWRLKIWPGKRGRTAKNLRAQLKNKGRAVVTVRLSYAETGQLPYLTSKRLTLLKKRPHLRHR